MYEVKIQKMQWYRPILMNNNNNNILYFLFLRIHIPRPRWWQSLFISALTYRRTTCNKQLSFNPYQVYTLLTTDANYLAEVLNAAWRPMCIQFSSNSTAVLIGVFTKKASSNLSAWEWNVNIYEKASILIFQCYERKHSKFDRNL